MPAGPVKIIVRVLMWVHFVYLLLLPTLAVVSARMLFPDSDSWQQIAIFGFPATLMYSLFLANGYAIPDSLPIALFQTVAIPLQIGLGVLIYGSSSIWLFFAESAAVGIGSFVFGVLTVALSNRKDDSSTGFFVFILFLAIVLFLWRHTAIPAFGFRRIWFIFAVDHFICFRVCDRILAVCRDI